MAHTTTKSTQSIFYTYVLFGITYETSGKAFFSNEKQVMSVLVRSFKKVLDVLTGTQWHKYHK